MRNSLETGSKYCIKCEATYAFHLRNTKAGLLNHCSRCGEVDGGLPPVVKDLLEK